MDPPGVTISALCWDRRRAGSQETVTAVWTCGRRRLPVFPGPPHLGHLSREGEALVSELLCWSQASLTLILWEANHSRDLRPGQVPTLA